MPAEEVKNKNLASVFGPVTAGILEQLCQKSLQGGGLSQPGISLEINGQRLVFNAAFIPVPQPEAGRQVLLISLHDITPLHVMQQKKERLRRQLVAALMRAIDLHDPYSANHSANTAFFALAIGRSMNLESDVLETVETAANLCNLGKLSIPKQVLTKTASLTAEEQELMKKEPEFARELLGQIDFDGPVCEAVVQKNECLDGSGYPDGLSAEQVILPARILAVANAFVAMISPRAYRVRFAVEDALDQLLKRAGGKYDRQVVAALFHVVENETDWSKWDDRQQKFTA
jgi:HD-GYP domain-containing protein (c-di-GMP phosphodiesterase class II)